MTKREFGQSKFGINTGDECLSCGGKNPFTIPSFTSPSLVHSYISTLWYNKTNNLSSYRGAVIRRYQH